MRVRPSDLPGTTYTPRGLRENLNDLVAVHLGVFAPGVEEAVASLQLPSECKSIGAVREGGWRALWLTRKETA